MKKYYWFNYIYNNTGSTISSARGAWYSRKIFHLVFLIESISFLHYVNYSLCLLQWPQYSPEGSTAGEMIYSLSKVHSRVFTQQWLPDMAGWAELRVGIHDEEYFFSRDKDDLTKSEVRGVGEIRYFLPLQSLKFSVPFPLFCRHCLILREPPLSRCC